jgi:thiol-disulfide isomerase/thioredoxin
MSSITLGPLALPLNPLLMMAGWWLAAWLVDRLAGPAQRPAARALMVATVVGLLAARGGFVALAWSAYAGDPVSMLDIRDGGWMPGAGAAAAGGALAGYGWRRADIRRPLALGALAGLAFWGMASLALGVHDKPRLPNLVLQDLRGTAARPLRGDGARPMVVNLWATWCGPCRAEMPHLADAQARYPEWQFVFVNQGEGPDAVGRWLGAQGFRLQDVRLDPDRALGAAVGSPALPTTLFVDAKGVIVGRHVGPLSAGSLAGFLHP